MHYSCVLYLDKNKKLPTRLSSTYFKTFYRFDLVKTRAQRVIERWLIPELANVDIH